MVLAKAQVLVECYSIGLRFLEGALGIFETYSPPKT
jgi:hypothetical protein